MRAQSTVFSIASACGLVAAFPPFNIWPLAWIALSPLFVIYRRSSLKESLTASLLAGVVFFGALLYWIAIFGYAPWILLTLFQTIFFIAFAFTAHWPFHSNSSWLRLLIAPALWVSFEWLRSLGLFGFTWGDLPQSQTRFLPVLQILSVTGPWGLSFIMVMANVAFAELWLIHGAPHQVWRRSVIQALSVAGIVAVIVVSGFMAIRRSDLPGKGIRVAVIQGNLDQELRPTETWLEHTERTISGYLDLTSAALKHSPDLVVWPETAIPGYLTKSDPPRWLVESLAGSGSAYFLVGASHQSVDSSGKSREHNGAFLFGPDGKLAGSYYKVHLVPFGEIVVGRRWLPFLDRYKIRDFDYSPGPGYYPIKARFGNVGVMICFESIFSYIPRLMTNRGANVLVVMTNDAWFKRTAAAEQHYVMSILRAVENRRY
ncbi:MAG: apolipoprotein N-acyltransferase, partial [Armatimonadota bacterium]|nr:apolipoprotein N-acyltransferase [Armatimonadota bacterium]